MNAACPSSHRHYDLTDMCNTGLNSSIRSRVSISDGAICVLGGLRLSGIFRQQVGHKEIVVDLLHLAA